MYIKTMSEYCKEQFSSKVYRIALKAVTTCPNRDGKVGFGGCSFCSEKGAGEFSFDANLDMEIELAKNLINKKFPKNIASRKYIAYFQSFTNTYGDTKKLESIFERVIIRDEIVAISIATRPDCLEDEKLEMLERLNKIKPVWVELGLQTTNEETAKRINRCYNNEVFVDSYKRLKAIGIEVIAHIILGLPDETAMDMYNTVTYLSKLTPRLDGIKFHLLHIMKGTRLEREYYRDKFKILSMEEYTDILINCLRILPEDVVIHRLTGDGDKKNLIEPRWSMDKKKVLNYINKRIKEEER